jgi:hypothetical protein
MTVGSMSPAGANSAGSGTGTMNVMRAIRIHRRGGPEALVYEDAPIPALRPGDSLVRVHAVGISRPSSRGASGRRPMAAAGFR